MGPDTSRLMSISGWLEKRLPRAGIYVIRMRYSDVNLHGSMVAVGNHRKTVWTEGGPFLNDWQKTTVCLFAVTLLATPRVLETELIAWLRGSHASVRQLDPRG